MLVSGCGIVEFADRFVHVMYLGHGPDTVGFAWLLKPPIWCDPWPMVFGVFAQAWSAWLWGAASIGDAQLEATAWSGGGGCEMGTSGLIFTLWHMPASLLHL